MIKQLDTIKQLSKMKAFYRMIYDICVVTFIVVITSEHMISHDYTFGRMCRFWTMWSCWGCAFYFFVAFCKQMTLLLFNFEVERTKKNKKRNVVMEVLVDSTQQTALVLCLCVSIMFWILYFKSPSAVFRVSDDWQPSLMEQLFVTHFEHSFPLVFLLVDCFVFSQGNKRVNNNYKYSRFVPLVAFLGYASLALYDFFRFNIRPYPFMDKWGLMPLLATLVVIVSILDYLLNPIAYYIRVKFRLR
ncbi:hypothetical protein EHI8A_022140 [Entamoeba histolytica HM-1:IMSS-B]|uniref:Uncharacterized protein n=6 Tax=Entamoeba histolytica TaxID=5759 RepID=C4LST2_ENTH1|nr:hypothetical protein EHI_152450 [Entamoeba histolytica HM-1:IMSS]EMD49279.1 Hypothetical protein EHI5A_000820 [Entamoeba histolytica KU27]EMH78126.1 hypothetical protein EHI8A_022140 [Entamoeba histolytica HM-1:IMSS-B]EMS10813.1 hypothetical protein KM1_001970 [Entamoeba histolytica HM-3:IMSS]ENY60696.1 hypothetical protein EHI7A_025610 [Entamoeba histolytica HM-1:IMSS-A]GAT91498.1 hypothetical protein CL6EHI_152450 [Entamoeba histolytica]|eukprot:XP_656966.1 hypothetical protein EHI_152450 [Entamoeba histolytica HM-1:IMSS]